uniref:Uncharacterized protein n=1 Tax=Placozoa sp. H17 HM-2017 TaxID=2017600 RepID=A0A7I6N2P9_9METZ|nr:hypothetical protein [Placozoa sp. H17 HM-2017]
MEYELILGPKEGATGFFLKKELGFGTISFDRKGSIKYHIKNEMHFNKLGSFGSLLKMPSILGRDPENPAGGPAIKILESAEGFEAVSATRTDGPAPSAPPATFGAPKRYRGAPKAPTPQLVVWGPNFNFDAWLSGFFETTCSFQIGSVEWAPGARSKMGKYSVSFFEKAGRRRPVFRPKGAFGARSLVNRRPAGPTIRVYPPFKSSFGIGAYPDNAPPFLILAETG